MLFQFNGQDEGILERHRLSYIYCTIHWWCICAWLQMSPLQNVHLETDPERK